MPCLIMLSHVLRVSRGQRAKSVVLEIGRELQDDAKLPKGCMFRHSVDVLDAALSICLLLPA